MYIRQFALTLWLSTLSLMAVSQEAYQVKAYEIKFLIENAGITVEGRLDSLEAEVRFHPRQPHKSRLVASVDPGTIRTGIKIRDNHLKRSDYFDVEHYPRVSLRSLGFSREDQNTILGRFKLTIKDVTREVTIPIHYVDSGHTLRLNGTFTINRLDFGLGEESILLADEVEVLLEASLERLKI